MLCIWRNGTVEFFQLPEFASASGSNRRNVEPHRLLRFQLVNGRPARRHRRHDVPMGGMKRRRREATFVAAVSRDRIIQIERRNQAAFASVDMRREPIFLTPPRRTARSHRRKAAHGISTRLLGFANTKRGGARSPMVTLTAFNQLLRTLCSMTARASSKDMR